MGSSSCIGEGSTTWHIYWQVAIGRDLLAGRPLIQQIRLRLIQAHERPGRKLVYFLVMPSEIHLLTTLTDGQSPGELACGVANVISRRVRQWDRTRGPVFAGRYQARRLETSEQVRQEVRMLAWRPVSKGLCRSPTYFVHSAFRIGAGLSAAKGYMPTALHAFFGGDASQGRAGVRKLVASRPTDFELLEWELAHGITLAGGAAGPDGPASREVRGAAAALVAASESKGIDGALWLLERWVQLKLRMPPGRRLRSCKGHAASRARALVANLAVDLGLCPAAEVARHFDRAKATLSEQMAASRARPEDQPILDVPLDRLVQEAISLSERGR